MVIFRTAGTGLYFCRGLKMTKSTTAAVAKALFGITRVFQKKIESAAPAEVRMLKIAKLCTREILSFSHILSQKLDFAQVA
jgi:hypothetical protein